MTTEIDDRKGQTGTTTAIYLQNDLRKQIDEHMEKHRDIYKSLSHFINIAASRELRRQRDGN